MSHLYFVKKQKLASVSLRCKSRCCNTADIKILSANSTHRSYPIAITFISVSGLRRAGLSVAAKSLVLRKIVSTNFCRTQVLRKQSYVTLRLIPIDVTDANERHRVKFHANRSNCSRGGRLSIIQDSGRPPSSIFTSSNF